MLHPHAWWLSNMSLLICKAFINTYYVLSKWSPVMRRLRHHRKSPATGERNTHSIPAPASATTSWFAPNMYFNPLSGLPSPQNETSIYYWAHHRHNTKVLLKKPRVFLNSLLEKHIWEIVQRKSFEVISWFFCFSTWTDLLDLSALIPYP